MIITITFNEGITLYRTRKASSVPGFEPHILKLQIDREPDEGARTTGTRTTFTLVIISCSLSKSNLPKWCLETSYFTTFCREFSESSLKNLLHCPSKLAESRLLTQLHLHFQILFWLKTWTPKEYIPSISFLKILVMTTMIMLTVRMIFGECNSESRR